MGAPVTFAELERIIRSCWSAETSDDPERWSSDNPADGNCGTTAYVIRVLMGGEIVLAKIVGTEPLQHHAWNRFAGGLDIDITRDQFRGPVELEERADISEEQLMGKIRAPGELLLARVCERLTELAPGLAKSTSASAESPSVSIPPRPA